MAKCGHIALHKDAEGSRMTLGRQSTCDDSESHMRILESNVLMIRDIKCTSPQTYLLKASQIKEVRTFCLFGRVEEEGMRLKQIHKSAPVAAIFGRPYAS